MFADKFICVILLYSVPHVEISRRSLSLCMNGCCRRGKTLRLSLLVLIVPRHLSKIISVQCLGWPYPTKTLVFGIWRKDFGLAVRRKSCRFRFGDWSVLFIYSSFYVVYFRPTIVAVETFCFIVNPKNRVFIVIS